MQSSTRPTLPTLSTPPNPTFGENYLRNPMGVATCGSELDSLLT